MIFRKYNESIKYLYIEVEDVMTGENVLIGQASCSYQENQQIQISTNIFNEGVYIRNKQEIDLQIQAFEAECREEFKNSNMGLLKNDLAERVEAMQCVLDEILMGGFE